MKRVVFCRGILAAFSLAACSGNSVDTYDDQLSRLEGVIEQVQFGRDVDHWIELRNLAGEWEKVGLIFGFVGDYDECLKAIQGLKTVNYAREYRCIPAQRKK